VLLELEKSVAFFWGKIVVVEEACFGSLSSSRVICIPEVEESLLQVLLHKTNLLRRVHMHISQQLTVVLVLLELVAGVFLAVRRGLLDALLDNCTLNRWYVEEETE
jgi:hypothetical protein